VEQLIELKYSETMVLVHTGANVLRQTRSKQRDICLIKQSSGVARPSAARGLPEKCRPFHPSN